MSEHQPHFFLKHRRADGRIAYLEAFTGKLLFCFRPLLCVAMIDVLEKRQNEDRLRRLALEITRIQERERKQFALYLHDEIGQNLAFIKMRLEAISYAASGALPENELAAVYSLLDATIERTRAMIFDLDSLPLYRLGLSKALRGEGKKICQGNGLIFFYSDGEVPPMSDDLMILIFRSAQELMRNCVKHARASRMELSLRSKGSMVILHVADDGIGFDVPSLGKSETCQGFGLFNIRERLYAIGGTLTIESRMGGGTRIELMAPIG